MGKIAFFTITDQEGKIQLYLEKKIIDDFEINSKLLSFDDLKEIVDIGDWIGVYGTIKKTNKGELSIKVSKWEMLSKSLQPLPDKWHGLTDIEKRYRQRYLDLIVNPLSKNVFKTRAKCISLIRRWLDEKNFLEIETPILQSEAGGAEARPFITHHNTLDIPLYLRIATELHLKRMVVGGFEKVYELGRIFRNEGISTKHNPEFTSVEIYQAFSNYIDMMKTRKSFQEQVEAGKKTPAGSIFEGMEKMMDEKSFVPKTVTADDIAEAELMVKNRFQKGRKDNAQGGIAKLLGE